MLSTTGDPQKKVTQPTRTVETKKRTFGEGASLVLAPIGGFFSAFFKNFLANYRRLNNVHSMPVFGVLLGVFVIPFALIQSFRNYTHVKNATTNALAVKNEAQAKEDGVFRPLVRLFGSAAYALASIATLVSIPTFFKGVGVAGVGISVLSGLSVGLLTLFHLAWSYNVVRTWKLSSIWEDFKALGKNIALAFRKLRNKNIPDKTHFLNYIGRITGHIFAAVGGVTAAFAAISIFPFAPLAMPVGVILGLVVFMDFDNYVPRAFARLVKNARWLFGRKVNMDDESFKRAGIDKNFAKQERQWANASPWVRWPLYGLAIGLTVWACIIVAPVLPGVLGTIAIVMGGVMLWAGFLATLKMMYNFFAYKEVEVQTVIQEAAPKGPAPDELSPGAEEVELDTQLSPSHLSTLHRTVKAHEARLDGHDGELKRHADFMVTVTERALTASSRTAQGLGHIQAELRDMATLTESTATSRTLYTEERKGGCPPAAFDSPAPTDLWGVPSLGSDTHLTPYQLRGASANRGSTPAATSLRHRRMPSQADLPGRSLNFEGMQDGMDDVTSETRRVGLGRGTHPSSTLP